MGSKLTRTVAAIALGIVAALWVLGEGTPAPAAIKLDHFEVAPSTTQAGTSTSLNMEIWHQASAFSYISPPDRMKELVLDLPVGLSANPNAAQTCSQTAWNDTGTEEHCPEGSRLGEVDAWVFPYLPLTWAMATPAVKSSGYLYRIPSKFGEPARFGLIAWVGLIYAKTEGYATLRTSDYGTRIVFPELPRFNSWGSHIAISSISLRLNKPNVWRNPTTCTPATTTVRVTSLGYYGDPDDGPEPPTTATRTSTYTPTGCPVPFQGALHTWAGPFDMPALTQAGSPQPLGIGVSVPGASGADVHGSTVRLPAGTTLSAARAAELQSCSDAAFGQGIHSEPGCPPGSLIGDVSFQSPAATTTGKVFLGPVPPQDPGSPGNPIPLLVSIGPIQANGVLGTWIKFRANMTIDPNTGEISTTLPASGGLPQVPFNSFRLNITGGQGSPLVVVPRRCGYHPVSGLLRSWSSGAEHERTAFLGVEAGRGRDCQEGDSLFDPGLTLTPPSGQAGSDSAFPEVRLSRNRSGFRDDDRLIKSFKTSLPPGWIGRLRGHDTCTVADAQAGACRPASRVGALSITLRNGDRMLTLPGTAYLAANPQPGAVAGLLFVINAQAGLFNLGRVVVPARIDVRPADNGLDISGELPAAVKGIQLAVQDLRLTMDHGFMVAPQHCPDPAEEITTTFTPQDGGPPIDRTAPFELTGCENVPFNPRLSLETVEPGGSRATGQPSAYRVRVDNRDEHGNPLPAAIKKAEITLPAGAAAWEGLGLHAPLANGITPCSQAEFNGSGCPSGSRLGDARINTSANLIGELHGGAFLGPVPTGANPGSPSNPYTLYLRLDSTDIPGMTLRLTADLTLDPATGAVTTTLNGLPPVPFEMFELTFRGGANAPLVNPLQCGELRATGSLTPAADPGQPHEVTADPVTIDQGQGEGCSQPRPFVPDLTLGSASGRAGSDTDFPALVFTRPDGDRLLDRVQVELPAGIVGRVHGRPRCPSVAAATAGNCDGNGSDPDARVGHTKVWVGSGVELDETVRLSGRVYLVQPRIASAVASLAIVIDGNAEPFDLGRVGIGAEIFLRPDDYGLTIVTDSFPTIHAGVPLATQKVELEMDDGFMVLPTRCRPGGEQFTARFEPVGGGAAHTADEPFEVTGCDELPFDPSLILQTGSPGGSKATGATSSYVAGLALGPGSAAVARASIKLPAGAEPWRGLGLSAPLAKGLEACTEEQFNSADGCPEASRLGDARVETATVGELSGEASLAEPVPQGSEAGTPAKPYRMFVRVRGDEFPAAVLRLEGEITLDRESGRVTTRLLDLPPLQFERFLLRFPGGARGTLVNPLACGSLVARASVAPASDPSSRRKIFSDPVVIDEGRGADCAAGERPFTPQLSLGASSGRAGSDDEFPKIVISRGDGDALMDRVTVSMPPGVVGRIRDRDRCASVDAAVDGSCDGAGTDPDARIGTARVRVGSGIDEADTLELPGRLYLLEARDAEFVAGLAIVIDGTAGPFDLGKVGVGADLVLRPHDYGIDIRTDPFPRIHGGIPLAMRRVELEMDDGFMVLPTRCRPGGEQFTARFEPVGGGAAHTADAPFEVTGCDELEFEPRLSLRPEPPTPQHTGHPAGYLTAVELSEASAALEEATIALPAGDAPWAGLGLFAPLANGVRACTEAEFNSAQGCPADSRLATAEVSTTTIGGLSGEASLGSPVPRGPDAGTPDNPYRLFIRVQGDEFPAAVLRIQGVITLDHATGKVRTHLFGLPPLQFQRFALTFRDGPTAAMVNPIQCETGDRLHATGHLVPASAPGSSRDVTSEPIRITEGKGDGCAAGQRDFQPAFELDRSSIPAGGGEFPAISITRPDGDRLLGEMRVSLPVGFIGRLANRPVCDDIAQAVAGACDDAQVGTTTVRVGDGVAAHEMLELSGRVFLVQPRRTTAVATLGIVISGAAGPFDLGPRALGADVELRPDYGLDIVVDQFPVIHAGIPLSVREVGLSLANGFMVAPQRCADQPEQIVTRFSPRGGGSEVTVSRPLRITGCDDLPFNPRVLFDQAAGSGSRTTGHPSAYEVGLANFDDDGQPYASAVDRTEITLPAGEDVWEGIGLHAPVANGLQACSDEEFETGTCPQDSQLGTALVDTGSDLVGRLTGAVFLGPVPTEPNPGTPQNPYRVFIRADSDDVPNITLKLAGDLTLDPETGAVRTELDKLPPIPFQRFQLTFRGGANAPLVNPLRCGRLRASGVITGASDPDNPRPVTSQEVAIDTGRGADCIEGPRGFEPELTLGSSSGRAGSDEDFPAMTFTRPDGDKLLERVRVELPPGVVGRVHGRERCADVDDAVAGRCDGDGDDPDARIGTVNVRVGSGVPMGDTVALPGSIYLTEARSTSSVLGMAIVINGEAGPFDLGKVGVAADILMRNEDYGLDIVTDKFPDIHAGVPLAIRQVTMDLDDGVMVLPTRCRDQRETITAIFTAAGGSDEHESPAQFRITDCDQVPFDPKLGFEAAPPPDGSRATGKPSSYVTAIELGERDAALHDATIALPAAGGPWKGIGLSAPVSRGLTACTEEQFNSPAGCPASSHLASAEVSTTTIGSLTGEAALGTPVPEGSDAGTPERPYHLFVRVRGDDFPAVSLRLRGEITLDRATGEVTSTLTGLPPVQFTRFALTFRGGTTGSLVNPIECQLGDGLLAAGALRPASAPGSPKDVTSEPVVIDEGRGERCAEGRRPFAPQMIMEPAAVRAGSDRFPTITLRRPDGDRLLGAMRIALPPGFVGRLEGRPRCATVAAAQAGQCPDARVGQTSVRIGEGVAEDETVTLPGEVFLVRPRRDGAVVSLAVVVDGRTGPFDLGRTAIGADIELRDDFGLDIVVDEPPLIHAGVPLAVRAIELSLDRGFMVAPTSCGWADVRASMRPAGDGPDDPVSRTAKLNIVACDGLKFDPSVTWERPSGAWGDPTAPSALTTRVTLGRPPRPERPFAALRSAAIRLPEGFGLSAPSANGLAACSPLEAASAAGCPPASRLATARIVTDTIGELRGNLFLLATKPGKPIRPQDDLRVHLQAKAVDVPGVTLQTSGRITVAGDGRLVARFGQAPDPPLPPVAFRSFELAFRGGVTAPVANAPVCGDHRLEAEFQGANGRTRGSLDGKPERSNPLRVEGRGCTPQFRPTLLLDGRGRGDQPARRAGADDDFPRITIGRPDADAPIDRFTVTLPEGFAGRLKGRDLCPSAADAVAGRCDGTSGEVGRALIDLGGARVPLDGKFPNTTLLLHPEDVPQVNRVFVTRPRRSDAVASLAIVVDGRTGPFDLGPAVIGADIFFGDDRRLRIAGDPIPTHHGGVPLTVRRISLDLVDGFMVNPIQCPADAPLVEASFVARDGTQHTAAVDYPLTGCDAFRFNPSMTVTPDDPTAARPSGYRVTIALPGEAGVAARTGSGRRPTRTRADRPQSALREATVVLPPGVALSAPVAGGLEVCGAAAFAGPGCPEASRLGEASVVTATLGRLSGGVYVGPVPPGPGAGTPERPIPVFVVVRGDEFPAAVLRLRGSLIVDQDTGQLTTRWTGLPPIAFTGFELHFRGGGRAPLLNPARCGTVSSDASRLVPWSSGTPAPVRTDVSIHAGRGPDCAAGGAPMAPAAAIEVDPPIAAAKSAVTVTLGREDGSQVLHRAQVTMPPGMIGDLSGVEFCPDDAAARDACPAASRVGTIAATVGAGPDPVTIQGGTVHLLGPRDGAAAGLAVSLPGTVGPFDVGRTLTRIRMDIAHDGTISVDTGELPLMRAGIPLMVRSLRLRLDRPGFMVNPSTCRPLELTGRFTGVEGGTATATAPLQLSGCDRLGYAPALSGKATLGGGTTSPPDAPADNRARPGTPKATVTVRGAAARPQITTRATAQPGGPALQAVELNLPRGLALNRARAVRAVTITADGRRLRRTGAPARRAQVRVTGARRLVVRLPRTGARTVSISLPAGAVRGPRRARSRSLPFSVGLVAVGGSRVTVRANAVPRRPVRRGTRPRSAASPPAGAAADSTTRQSVGLTFSVEQGAGEANTARLSTLLPAAFEPNPAALNRGCPPASLASGTCSERSQIGTVTAVSSILPLTLSGPLRLVERPGAIPGLRATIGVAGIVELQIEGSLSIEGGRLRATFDNLPDLPLQRLEVTLGGDRDDVLLAIPAQVCGTKPQMDASFTSHTGATVERRLGLSIDGCGDAGGDGASPGVTAGAPLVQVRTTGRPGGHPAVQVRVRRRSAAMPALRQIVVTLPKSLRVEPRAAKSGLRVTAVGRRVPGRSVSLSRNGRLAINLTGAGAGDVTATLDRGTIRWRRIPRRLTRGLPGPLEVRLAIRDERGKTHTLRRRSGGAAPATAVRIQHSASPAPTVTLRVRTRPRTPEIDRLVVHLPRALRANPARARGGLEVTAGGRALPERAVRLTRSGQLTITLPATGTRQVTVTLRAGAVHWAGRRGGRLAFHVRTRDINGQIQRSRATRSVTARSSQAAPGQSEPSPAPDAPPANPEPSAPESPGAPQREPTEPAAPAPQPAPPSMQPDEPAAPDPS